MLTQAQALLDLIELGIALEPCQPTVSRVTAGEPAAPNPGCTDVAVWVGQVEDTAAFDSQCIVRTALTLNYRIGWCYQESPNGPSVADELEAASCLYGLMEAVWCELVTNGRSLVDSCRDVLLGAFTVSPRSGGWVSAQGTVTIPYDCATPAS